MGKGRSPSRRAMWLGVFVASLVLALGLPAIALASPVAFFQNVNPASGSTSMAASRMLSVTVYDRYGVRYMSNMTMSLDGVRVAPTWKPWAGYGFRKFTLKYAAMNMSVGAHTVAIRIHDQRGNTVNYSWSFTVGASDSVPPVTTSQMVTLSGDGATILLHATDSGSGVARTYYTLDGVAGEGAIVFTDVAGPHALVFWSVDVAGNIEAHHTLNFTVAPSVFAHAAPAIACTVVGCHGGKDVATIHWAVKCTPCHAPGVTPTTDCTVCHGANGPADHQTHVTISSASTPACTQAGCHTAALVGIHPTCATCHDSADSTIVAAIAAGGATCETCHGVQAVAHVAIGSAHTVASGSCFVATCHGTDVTKMHTSDFRGTGALPPGCAACHAAGTTPSTNCTDCHTDIITPHDYAAAHARVQPLVATNSSACTACHGSDFTKVLPVPTSVPAPTAFTEHNGCSCHAYSEARGKTSCEGCHTGAHAAHGFASTAATPTVSGHNTPNYGTKGVFERFDGSTGNPLLLDSEGDAVETTWTFPTVNVFWSSTDASAPATAIKGLTKDSVVTCQDCHTGLGTVAGPHGAAEQFGIDPNYDYPFKYAIVGGPAGANSATDASLNYFAPGQVARPGRVFNLAATPATATTGIPASASGIKARIASNLSTSTNAPVQIKSTNPADLMITNYNNYPDNRGAEYIADATSGQYAVICAKCHDLYNWASRPATNAVDNGWSNAGPDSFEGMHGAHAGGTAANGNDVGRIDGRSDCVNCHVAIPHAWRQPRLLVNGFTGNYTVNGEAVASVADPFPYFQGRGMPFSTAVGLVAPTPNSPANGPNDAKDDHSANAFGKPVWEEAACISCSGDVTKSELEHKGIATEPAKIK